MNKKTVTPRIMEETKIWYGKNFSSAHAGIAWVLESFPHLYRRTMTEIRRIGFTREELIIIIDVYNANPLMPGMPVIKSKVQDGIALDRLDKKWGIDGDRLVEKVSTLSSFQSACLEIWARGYRYAEINYDPVDLQKYVESL
jgi:hypothetical protein